MATDFALPFPSFGLPLQTAPPSASSSLISPPTVMPVTCTMYAHMMLLPLDPASPVACLRAL